MGDNNNNSNSDDYTKLKSEIMNLVSEEFSKTKNDIISIIIENNKLKSQTAVLEKNSEELQLPPSPLSSFIHEQKQEDQQEYNSSNSSVNNEELQLPPPPPEEKNDGYEDQEKEIEETSSQSSYDDDYYRTVHPLGIQDTYEDDEYFSSYSKISLHHEMVFDKRRTAAYYHAISKSKNLFKDKVVLDVGCGTGILSCFVAKHGGAKRVYAVDASGMANNAELIVQRNGLGDKVTVIKGKLEHIAFPEYVDIIVSEWMGAFLIFESMLESVIYARDNLLKPGGLILPSKACIYLSPINVDSYYHDKVNQWNNVFDLDMSPLIPFAQEELLEGKSIRNHYIDDVNSVLDKPIILRTLDLKTITIGDLSKTVLNFDFNIAPPINGSINKWHGFGTWFSVWFENLDNDGNYNDDDNDKDEFVYYTIDKVGELVKGNYKKDELDKGLTPLFFKQTSNILELSTAIGTGDQHWKQVLFLNPKEKLLSNNGITKINGTVRIIQNRDYRRHWWIEFSTSLKSPDNTTDHYYQKYLI